MIYLNIITFCISVLNLFLVVMALWACGDLWNNLNSLKLKLGMKE